MDLVVIDTVELCGNTKDLTFTNVLDYLSTRSFPPQGPLNATAANAQWTWIEGQLRDSQ